MGVNLLTLARFALKGPYQAAAVVGLLAVLASFIPPMLGQGFVGFLLATLCMLLSSTLVSLIILTQGSVSGIKPILVSMLGISLVSWALIGNPWLGLWVGLVQWLPIILLSQTLRSTRSLAMMLLAGVALGAVAIAVQFLSLGEADMELMARTFQRMGALGQGSSGEEVLVPAEQAKQIVNVVVVGFVAMLYLLLVPIVLLARWTQARLADSKAFGEEFRQLALGKTAALIALIVAALGFLMKQPWLASLLYLLVIAFMFQGIAIVHARVKGRRPARLILSVFYCVLLIAPMAVALTALTGVIDNWLVFRKRVAQADTDNED